MSVTENEATAEPGLFEVPAPPAPKSRRLHRKKPAADGDGGDKPKDPKERTPTRAGARTSLREMGTGIAKALGFFASNTGLQGASRALMLQSEAWGPAFDQAVRGTFIDRALQPLARVGGNSKDLAALAALPITTEAYLRDPNPMTQAGFQAALVASLPQIAKARKTAAKEQAKLEADLADLAEMFGKDEGERVTLNEVAMWLMTGSTDGTPVAPPEPAAEPDPF